MDFDEHHITPLANLTTSPTYPSQQIKSLWLDQSRTILLCWHNFTKDRNSTFCQLLIQTMLWKYIWI